MEHLVSKAGVDLAAGLGKLGFEVSSKSVVFSSSPALSQKISHNLRQTDGQVSPVQKGADLGVDFGNAKKPLTKFKARGLTADSRTKRVKKLGVQNRKQAFAASCVAKKVYPSVVRGLAPSWLAALRGQHATALGRGQGLCTTAFLEIGGHKNLAVQLPQKVLTDWLLFWHRSENLHQDIEETWQAIRSEIDCLSQQARWSSKATDGPTGGAIATLLDMGWLSLSSTRWEQNSGTTWVLSTSPCDFTPLVQVFNASPQRLQ